MRSSRQSWRSPATVLAALLILAGGSLAACAAGASTAPSAAVPVITDAWIRVPGADATTAAYFTISNPGSQADTLLSASSPMADGCQLHQTSMDSSGMTGMHMIDRMDIPAGGMMKLEPGGYHLMMNGVKALTIGSKVELDLTFQKAGTVKVMAEVRAG
jgi:copper(I)-binding protein